MAKSSEYIADIVYNKKGDTVSKTGFTEDVKLLRLPIARIGTFVHRDYGVVKFDQQDFDTIQQNFNHNIRGYEPFVHRGHFENGPKLPDKNGKIGGEPADAHLIQMFQEGDVLFGRFEPHNQDVVKKVDNGEYRYISPEVVRNAKDKLTGNPTGPFLVGVALTNEPFIPNLPRNSTEVWPTLMEKLTDVEDSQTVSFKMDSLVNPQEPKLEEKLPKSKKKLLGHLSEAVKSLLDRIERLPQEIVGQLTAPKPQEETGFPGIPGALQFSDPVAPNDDKTELPIMTEPVQDVKPAEQPEATAPEAPAAAEAPVAEAPAPEAPVVEAPKDEVAELKQKLEQVESEKAAIAEELSKAVANQESIKAAAEAAAQAAEEAAKAAEIEAAKAIEANAEQAFVLQLTDAVGKLKQKYEPARVDAAANLITLVKSRTNTIQLSEGGPDIMSMVFGLLGDPTVQTEQLGSQDSGTVASDNPWDEWSRIQEEKLQRQNPASQKS